jgi:phosphatidate phosphatase APP1
MKNNFSKLAVLLSVMALTGCSTGFSDSTTFPGFDNSIVQTSSVAAQFSDEIENEEVLIDADYYKHFPDPMLGNDVIGQIEAGVIPEYTPEPASPEKDYQSQSFLSFFNKKAIIDIFDSYGTPGKVTVSGRIYKKKSVERVMTSDSKFTNILRNIKYYTPDAIGNIDVDITAGSGISAIARTDSKGYFKATLNNTGLQPGISKLTAKLNTTKYKYDIPQEEVVIDQADSDKVGVVSDFDDTVKYTGVNTKIKMVIGVLTGNYKTDKAYSGVATLYKGILGGPDGTGFDCMHYVTGGTAHLFSRIDEFLKLNRFPQGSIDMKKPGSTADFTPSDTFTYKVSRIVPVMNAYPHKKFVFFGDTTQKDTEVYLKIKEMFPDRVAGIYINNVNHYDPANPRFQGVMLTDSAIDSARDLLAKGIITQATVDQVTDEVK